ncbi:MAG: glycosyl hydrolase family 18 protein, partial [Dehalococcoidia bacterium]
MRPGPVRDPAPLIIGGTVAFLALIILVLFVAPFSPLVSDDGGEETTISDTGIKARREDSVPSLSPNLLSVSPFYTIEAPEDAVGPASITIRLLQKVSEGDKVGFYTFEGDHWQRVAPASLETDGSEASAEFPQIPDNLAVLQVIKAFQVAGSLPTEASLHPEAEELLDIASPRDYTPESDGSITGQVTPVELSDETSLIPTIVGSDESGSAAVADILSDDSVRQAHIDAIVQLASEGGFAGIDLDYTRLDASARSQFTEFVRALAERLHQDGLKLSLALPAVGSDEEGEEGAYDWKELGEAADIIKIQPLADPTRYWEETPKALDFAVAQVDPQKLFLVVDPTSARQDGGQITAVGYREAMLLATQL